MGFFDKFKKIFTKTKKDEALQIDSKRSSVDLNRLNNRFTSIESDSDVAENQKHFNYPNDKDTSEISELPHTKKGVQEMSEPVQLQKESLQLGVAAGYTGRAIREIESSLSRIEREMPSRDWFLTNFADQTKTPRLLAEIKNILENHELNASKRFESIEFALNLLGSTVKDVPEPLRAKLITDIQSIRSNLPLTSKMRQLISTVKQSGRISYDDLASNLDISRSSLRGLLSNTIKRTNEIERFTVNGKGWVLYKYPKTTQIKDFP